MKKVLLVGTIVLFCALALAGCAPVNTATVYDTLNKLADKEYSSITLNVSMTVNGITLTGEYVSTATGSGYQVSYTYEQIATFGEADGNIVIPDSYKETYSGTAVITGGVVTSQSGDEIDLSIGQLIASGLDFSANNFSNVTQSNGSLTAKVTNVNGFLRQAVSASNMMITVSYSENALLSLKIEYSSESAANVTLTYNFN